jgi:formyltetrahydrofolate deformylase
MRSGILLIDCPDGPGLVAAIAQFLYARGGNILHADQHQDNEMGKFFMRIEWSLDEFTMAWTLAWAGHRLRIALFVSHHGLIDLLHRHQIGELEGDIALVISNHQDAKSFADFYAVPFHHFPVTSANKLEVEARYMQDLSPQFVARFPERIINVHHSFLPAFSGAKPYHAAFERGVKLIGATSHYVTEQLDEGPIIEQDVARVSHRDQVYDLVKKGRDLERVVRSRAVRWHLRRRILFYGNKTVVFD